MKQFFTALFVVFCVAMNAQVIVTGRITGDDGQALIGANAVLKNTFNGDKTGLDGYFTITNVASGNYTLVISYVGFETVEKPIVIGTDDVFFNLTLKKNAIISDEIVVYATRANEKTPTSFINLDKKEIEQFNFGQDMPYMVELTPSVVVNSDAGNGIGYTGLRIRGSDATRINVTINGVPLNDAEGQGVFWVNMPDFASSVEDIQVQRGVGTSTNGGSAFGATINLFTTKLQPEFYAELNNTVGSFGTVKNTLKLGSGLINNHFSFDGRVSRLVSNGFVDRASSNLFSYYLSGAYYGKNQSLRLNLFHGQERTYQSWYGITFDQMQTLGRTYNFAGTDKPGEPYEDQVDDYFQTHYQLIYNKEISNQLNFNATAHYTKGAGYYEEYKGEAFLGSYGIEPAFVTSDLVRQRWLDNDFYGLIFSLNHTSADGQMETTVGGGWNNYIGSHFGDVIWVDSATTSALPHRYYENQADKNDFNLYAKTNYQINSRVNGFLDLQYRRIGYNFLGVDEDGSELDQGISLNFFNPKLGLTYEYNPTLQFYGFLGIGNKEPNRNDFVDNPPTNQPKAETLYNAEIGYKQVFKHASVTLNYYYMYYQNQLVVTGEINDVGAAVRTNIDQSYRSGIEFAGQAKISKYFDWAGNITFSRNRIIAFDEYIDSYDSGFNWIGWDTLSHNNTQLAFSPPVNIGNQLTFHPFAGNLKFSKSNQFNISLLTKWVGKQYVDNSSGRFLRPYMTNDLRLSYLLKFGEGSLSDIFDQVAINFLVKNLFNVEYEPNAWSYRYAYAGALTQDIGFYPQAGTHFMMSVNLKF